MITVVLTIYLCQYCIYLKKKSVYSWRSVQSEYLKQCSETSHSGKSVNSQWDQLAFFFSFKIRKKN